MSKDGGGYGSDSEKVRNKKLSEFTDAEIKAEFTRRLEDGSLKKEEVIKSIKRIHGYCIAEAHRYGPIQPDRGFIATIEYLMKEFKITQKDLEK